MRISRTSALLAVLLLTSRGEAQTPQPPTFGITFMGGVGRLFEPGTTQDATVVRLAIQLGGTRHGTRTIETTADGYLITAGAAGAAFGASGGVNFIRGDNAYIGPVVGALFVDNMRISLGARAGMRPERSGLRPELRADAFLHGGDYTLFIGVLIGLEAR